MEIAGPVDEIARFKHTCIRVADTGEPEQLDFNVINPVPEAVEGSDSAVKDGVRILHSWLCSNWGTDRSAANFHVSRDEPGHYECHFDTAWAPPIPIWQHLGDLFPTLDFSLNGVEEFMDFEFRGAIRDGKLELSVVTDLTERTTILSGLDDAIAIYLASKYFADLAPVTRRLRRNLLKNVRAEVRRLCSAEISEAARNEARNEIPSETSARSAPWRPAHQRGSWRTA
jgi:hypothetical protein